MVWLRWIVARADGIVAMRIEWLSHAVLRFDAVMLKNLMQLLQRHLHALAKLLARGHMIGDRTFKIVDHRQQLANESFLLRRGTAVGFLRSAFSEIIEIRSEA